jgi:IS1 family transposase
MEQTIVNLRAEHIQVDEIWTFVGKKQRRLTVNDTNPELGDQYVFVALDADTKLIPAWRVGKRNKDTTFDFMEELAGRINGGFQISSDQFPAYPEAIETTLAARVSYGQVHKIYDEDPTATRRYSPGKIVRTIIRPISGHPDIKHISTSYIERQNLTMRMQMRRFTRLTNAYSKKLENLQAALSLYFWNYNFARVHETLRVTPAMQAGLEKRILTWEGFLRNEIQRNAA